MNYLSSKLCSSSKKYLIKRSKFDGISPKTNLELNSFVVAVLSYIVREAAKKKLFFFSGPTTKSGGGGVRARPLRKKELFFISFYILAQKLWRNFCLSKSVSGYFKTTKNKNKKKVPMTTKPRGVKALVVEPLKKELFFAASLSHFTNYTFQGFIFKI